MAPVNAVAETSSFHAGLNAVEVGGRIRAAIPAYVPWTVLVESERDYVGTVSVALKQGTLQEAANAMSMLRGVVGAATLAT
jgi:hypothetical protein